MHQIQTGEIQNDTTSTNLRRSPLFFGSAGLRAGWGILLFLLLLSVAWFGFVGFIAILHLRHPASTSVAGHLGTPAALMAQAVCAVASIVASACLLGPGKSISGAKAASILLLLLLSVSLFATSLSGARQARPAPAPHPRAAKAPALAGSSLGSQLGAFGVEAGMFSLVAVASWVMSRVEDRRFGDYGLGARGRRWPQFAHGLLAGFGFLSLLVGGLWLGHWISFDGLHLHSLSTILGSGLIWALTTVMIGLFEEFLFRGYLQYTLARGIGHGARGFFLAAILLNFGFGLVHGNNPGESPFGMVSAGLVGVIFCLSLWYTRSLWWAIGAHAAWDWAESFFYGTADSGGVSRGRLLDTHPRGSVLLSGGATGPEGSVLCIVILVAMAGYAWWTLRQGRSRDAV